MRSGGGIIEDGVDLDRHSEEIRIHRDDSNQIDWYGENLISKRSPVVLVESPLSISIQRSPCNEGISLGSILIYCSWFVTLCMQRA